MFYCIVTNEVLFCSVYDDSPLFQHQDSTVSQISGFSVADTQFKKSSKIKAESMSMIHSSFDLAHTLTKNDYFSDINPRSMRRFMNIVAVTGSLFVPLGQNFFYLLIYKPSYCNFPESRKKNKILFQFFFYLPTLNIICLVEKIINF